MKERKMRHASERKNLPEGRSHGGKDTFCGRFSPLAFIVRRSGPLAGGIVFISDVIGLVHSQWLRWGQCFRSKECSITLGRRRRCRVRIQYRASRIDCTD
ncbi:hypothetical protein I7I53_11824 [Histoplasma capsulatum var. duboisii H88]|uniref:Uncharacterized protein n=2 Tax=Ajellomyces capsulatus TaxID=5037 RepID=A0A8H7Z2L3_AJECA|nr:hypothetical protein I7I52_10485 [Histoplasma capsulatum]QSS57592.1 hypothetical protein I7I53_11824 [Histoplasma capsulatum var. duboisii H88]QSS67388.1 hypothetical protein I7I50_06442 [Histoplasma capsulatum G186AR]